MLTETPRGAGPLESSSEIRQMEMRMLLNLRVNAGGLSSGLMKSLSEGSSSNASPSMKTYFSGCERWEFLRDAVDGNEDATTLLSEGWRLEFMFDTRPE